MSGVSRKGHFSSLGRPRDKLCLNKDEGHKLNIIKGRWHKTTDEKALKQKCPWVPTLEQANVANQSREE